MFDVIGAAFRASLVTFLLCGFAYPLSVTALGQWLMPFQANGSLIRGDGGAVLGSLLIGQEWTDPQWFHGRPSATTDVDSNDATKTVPAPYNAASSGASNLGPTSKVLEGRVLDAWLALYEAEPESVNDLLPADMLTTSASGLDPDISPANAFLQVNRVAKARRAPPPLVAALVQRQITPRGFGLFGELRVNVLQLNLALDREFPMRKSNPENGARNLSKKEGA
jgi:K+-transporting ATPase ATPase C chain